MSQFHGNIKPILHLQFEGVQYVPKEAFDKQAAKIAELEKKVTIAIEALQSVFDNKNANKGDWHRCREALEKLKSSEPTNNTHPPHEDDEAY